jgi:hypothetical protein
MCGEKMINKYSILFYSILFYSIIFYLVEEDGHGEAEGGRPYKAVDQDHFPMCRLQGHIY